MISSKYSVVDGEIVLTAVDAQIFLKADAPPAGSRKVSGRRVPGVCDPGLLSGYAPHTSDLLHPGRGAEGRGVCRLGISPLQTHLPLIIKSRSAALRAGGCGGLLSVGTSPSGSRTYGYAHSPLRGVRPPGTETPVCTEALGTQNRWARKTDGHAKQMGTQNRWT